MSRDFPICENSLDTKKRKGGNARETVKPGGELRILHVFIKRGVLKPTFGWSAKSRNLPARGSPRAQAAVGSAQQLRQSFRTVGLASRGSLLSSGRIKPTLSQSQALVDRKSLPTLSRASRRPCTVSEILPAVHGRILFCGRFTVLPSTANALVAPVIDVSILAGGSGHRVKSPAVVHWNAVGNRKTLLRRGAHTSCEVRTNRCG